MNSETDPPDLQQPTPAKPARPAKPVLRPAAAKPAPRQAEPGAAPTQLSLLDTVIVILVSCSLVIFVFTIGAKFLGRDTFDKLPDFLKDSYAALWSAGAVAGGALLVSVVDTLSRREATRGSFLRHITFTTLLIMALIVGTVELSRLVEGPPFAIPAGASRVNVTSNTSAPVSFYMQNRMTGGNLARIRGTYEIKDGQLTGNVTDSELEPITFMPGLAPALPLTSISIHVCYLAVRNGFPLSTQRPEFPVAANRQALQAMTNMQQPYPVPDFRFTIDVARIENIGPPYLCAYVDGPRPALLYY